MPSLAKKKLSAPAHDSRSVPVVSEAGGVRTLHFGSDYIQSQMVVGEPDFLALAYTRTMMSFEMFVPRPREIALLGLGGGSIAKWCHRHHAESRITVVEINPQVIAVAEAFDVPPLSEKFRILCDDAAKFVASPPTRFDVLLIDCFTTEHLPPELCSREFYDHCHQAMTDGGLMVANLCGRRHRGIVARIRKSFRGQVLLSSDKDGNTVVFACKGELLWPQDEDEDSLQGKLKQFERKYGLGKALVPKG